MKTGTRNSQRTANTHTSYTKQGLSKQPQIFKTRKTPETNQKDNFCRTEKTKDPSKADLLSDATTRKQSLGSKPS